MQHVVSLPAINFSPPSQGLQHLQSSSICKMAKQIGSLGQGDCKLSHRTEGAGEGLDLISSVGVKEKHNTTTGQGN